MKQKNVSHNKIFIFPLSLAVIFFASMIIIFSPVGKKNIVKVTPVITSEKALEIVQTLPEVISENKLLSAKKVSTTLYIESEPTSTDSNFHIYYGELQRDHQNRFLSFLVDSKTGKITVDTIIDPEPVDYTVWKNNCQLQSCKNK